jgi:hypothetical protein
MKADASMRLAGASAACRETGQVRVPSVMSDRSSDRSRWRLSVRELMTFVLVLGGGLGRVVHRDRVQRDAVAAIRQARGSVSYSASGIEPRKVRGRTIRPWSKHFKPLVDTFGRDYFARDGHVSLPDKVDDALMAHLGHLEAIEMLQILGVRGLPGARLVHLKGLTACCESRPASCFRTAPAENLTTAHVTRPGNLAPALPSRLW